MKKIYMRLAMIFTSLLLFTFMVNAQHIFQEYVVLDAWDDSEEAREPLGDDGLPPEYIGECDVESSDLELCWDYSAQYVAIIFRDVALEKGQWIDSAFIQFTAKDAYTDFNDDVVVDIYGSAEDVVQPLDTIYFNISDRPITTAIVSWTIPQWVTNEATLAERTVDIGSIISEIISKDTWASGNDLMIMFTSEVVTSHKENTRAALSGDKGIDVAPKLQIYAAPVGVENIKSEFVSLIYPNPTEGKLHIKNPSTGSFSYNIIDVTGRLVGSRRDITASETEFDLSDYAKGAYFINLTTPGKTETFKVVYR